MNWLQIDTTAPLTHMFRAAASVVGRRALSRSAAGTRLVGKRAALAPRAAVQHQLPPAAGFEAARALATVGVGGGGGGGGSPPVDDGGGTMKVVSIIFGCLGAYMVRPAQMRGCSLPLHCAWLHHPFPPAAAGVEQMQQQK